MNLKKGFIGALLAVGLACASTVNVKAATSALPARAYYEDETSEALSATIELPEGVSIAGNSKGDFQFLFYELKEYHEIVFPNSPVYVIPAGFDNAAGINLSNFTLEGATGDPITAKITATLPSGYQFAKLVKHSETEVIEIPSTSANGTITFDAILEPDGVYSLSEDGATYYHFYAFMYLSKSGAGSGSSNPWYEAVNDAFTSIKSAKDGDVAEISGIDTLTSGMMQCLAEKKNVSLHCKYSYQGVNYEIFIPAGKVILVEGVDYYGPLFLYSLYGEMQQDGDMQNVSGDYKIMPGDTLGSIAAKNGTTVNALMELNPQIKNVNRIYAGKMIRVK